MLDLTFGDPEQVARAARGVNAIHDRVHGSTDAHSPPFRRHPEVRASKASEPQRMAARGFAAVGAVTLRDARRAKRRAELLRVTVEVMSLYSPSLVSVAKCRLALKNAGLYVFFLVRFLRFLVDMNVCIMAHMHNETSEIRITL